MSLTIHHPVDSSRRLSLGWLDILSRSLTEILVFYLLLLFNIYLE